MSSSIADLKPEVAAKARELMAAAERRGFPIRVTQTLRSYSEQRMLYEQGRSRPGPIVTNAPPGWSWHNHARAFDVCFRGRSAYIGPWDQLGALGESLGLEWGGRWQSFPDRPHFQDRGGLRLAQARALHQENLA